MPRRGENIYKRKDGRWEGRFIKEHDISNRARYGYVYGKSYSEVKQKLKNICAERELYSGNQCIAQYDEIFNQWLSSVQVNVKESTYARYFQLSRTHILPVLGKYPIDKITASLLEQYTNSLLKSGRLDGKGGLSAKTVSDVFTIIKSSLKYAVNNGYLVKCNFESISVKKN